MLALQQIDRTGTTKLLRQQRHRTIGQQLHFDIGEARSQRFEILLALRPIVLGRIEQQTQRRWLLLLILGQATRVLTGNSFAFGALFQNIPPAALSNGV